MKNTFSIVSFALLFAANVFAGPQPNVLIILADDVGYSDLGCMGSEIKTSHLDRLARDGVLYTQAYNTAKCFPTRVHLVDIPPTVAALAGAKNPATGQGININNAFQNKPLQREGNLYWQWGGGNAIRKGDMKLVRHNGGDWELYDLAKDRTELNNLAREMPELVRAPDEAWNAWWIECTGSEFKPKTKSEDK